MGVAIGQEIRLTFSSNIENPVTHTHTYIHTHTHTHTCGYVAMCMCDVEYIHECVYVQI